MDDVAEDGGTSDGTADAVVRVARAMAAGVARWGGIATGLAGLASLASSAANGRGASGVAAAGLAAVLGGALAIAVLAVAPRMVADTARLTTPGTWLVVALALYGFWATLVVAVAAWLIRWDGLPRREVGWGLLAATLVGTVGLLRGFVGTRTLTFGDQASDVGHTPGPASGAPRQ